MAVSRDSLSFDSVAGQAVCELKEVPITPHSIEQCGGNVIHEHYTSPGGRPVRQVWRKRRLLSSWDPKASQLKTQPASEGYYVQHWALQVEGSSKCFEFRRDHKDWSVSWVHREWDDAQLLLTTGMDYYGKTEMTDEEIFSIGTDILRRDPMRYSIFFHNCQVLVTDVAHEILLPGYAPLPNPWYESYIYTTALATIRPLFTAMRIDMGNAQENAELMKQMTGAVLPAVKGALAIASAESDQVKKGFQAGDSFTATVTAAWRGSRPIEDIMERYRKAVEKVDGPFTDNELRVWERAARLIIPVLRVHLTARGVVLGGIRTLLSSGSRK